MTNGHDDKYSHWESNPDQRFRKPPFYPLNYESIGVRRGVFRPDKNLCFASRGAPQTIGGSGSSSGSVVQR